jgi:two-component system heavy metal sensor histidine kinase CusS
LTPVRSLALRLGLLYAAATVTLLLALGIGLAWLVRAQLEVRDREEIDGKTEVVWRLLQELGTAERIDAGAARFAEVAVGHPHLQIGLRRGTQWLVPLAPEIAGRIDPGGNDDIPHRPRFGEFSIGTERWWMRRVDFITAGDRVYAGYIGVHVSPTQQLVRNLISAIAAAGLLGLAASAALGVWVARRGLAPIAQIAALAERVTADHLGAPLRADDAPAELRGLVNAINHMLGRLRESFDSLEQFSADLAHELRTPLSNLMLQTQVTLSRPRSADEYRETLHSNLAELERLQRMVADMLFLARADKGMLELTREAVDLAQEARDVAEYFEPAAAEAQQRIEVDGAALAPSDRSTARRAITNLISNAVRYSPPGALIRVIATQSAHEARVQVENPAMPLGPDELRRLFDRFNRGDKSAGRTTDGTGLGLSIVASIMRLHGGRADAESGAFGIRFTLVFPLREARD